MQLNNILKGQHKHQTLYSLIFKNVLILYLHFITLSNKLILRMQIR